MLDTDDHGRGRARCAASLDGLPLAIELAAARVRSLSIREIARRLDDRFALLRDPEQPPARSGGGRWPARSRWSYDLLFPDDQRGLWALACFAGGASLDAAEQVLAALDVPAGAVLDTIGRLVDRSLVIVDGADGRRQVRYRLLDSIRLFAAERLGESGCGRSRPPRTPTGSPSRRAGATRTSAAHRQPDVLAFARAERANIDAALAWCAARTTRRRLPDRQRLRLDLGRARRRHGRCGPGPERLAESSARPASG